MSNRFWVPAASFADWDRLAFFTATELADRLNPAFQQNIGRHLGFSVYARIGSCRHRHSHVKYLRYFAQFLME